MTYQVMGQEDELASWTEITRLQKSAMWLFGIHLHFCLLQSLITSTLLLNSSGHKSLVSSWVDGCVKHNTCSENLVFLSHSCSGGSAFPLPQFGVCFPNPKVWAVLSHSQSLGGAFPLPKFGECFPNPTVWGVLPYSQSLRSAFSLLQIGECFPLLQFGECFLTLKIWGVLSHSCRLGSALLPNLAVCRVLSHSQNLRSVFSLLQIGECFPILQFGECFLTPKIWGVFSHSCRLGSASQSCSLGSAFPLPLFGECFQGGFVG